MAELKIDAQRVVTPLRTGGFLWRMLLYFGVIFGIVMATMQWVELNGVPGSIFRGQTERLRSAEFSSLNLVADLKKERLILWLDERRSDAIAISENPDVKESIFRIAVANQENAARGRSGDELWAAVQKEAAYDRLLQSLEAVKGAHQVYTAIQIVDSVSGRIIATTIDGEAGSIHSRGELSPIGPALTNRIGIALEENPRTQKLELVVSRRIETHSGSTPGVSGMAAVLIMSVDADDVIVPMLHTGGGLGDTGEALLVNQDVQILAPLAYTLRDGSAAVPMEYKIEAEPAVRAARGEEGIIAAEDYRGEPVLAAYRFIPISDQEGWGMVVKRDEREIFGSVRESIVATAAVGLLGILLVLGFAYVVALNLSRPIRLLHDAARQVEAGDLSVRAPIASSDEVGALASTFNSMTSRIQQWSQELEQQVQDRTQELAASNDELRAEIDCRIWAEEALRDSEERFRDLYENAPIAYFSVGVDGLITGCNSHATHLFGYSEVDLMGKSVIQLYADTPLGKEKAMDIAKRFRSGGMVRDEELQMQRSDGTLLWTSLTVNAIRDSNGKIIESRSMIRDITERKIVEQEVRRLASVVSNTSECILITDSDGRIDFANEASMDLLGYDRDEILGMNLWDIYHELGQGADASGVFLASVDNGAWSGETLALRRNDEEISVWVNTTTMQNQENASIGVVSIARDTTERKFLQKQLLHSQKMEAIGRLAGGVAHDFNNLLTPILSFSELIMMDLAPDTQMYGYVEQVKNAAERGAKLIRQLLIFSRRDVAELREVNLNSLVIGTGKMLQRLIGEDIELVHVLGPDVGVVRVDPSQMEQALVNMTINALDAMPDGGKLTIETSEVILGPGDTQQVAGLAPGRYVKLSVTDTGVGIDEAVKAHVFEPFYTTKEPGKGTGLGLALCYGMAKDSGGDIIVNSELGQGSTFEIYLPSVEEIVTAEVKRKEPDEMPRGSETLLVVEDEPAVRRLVVEVLKRQGYIVLEAANGEEALRVAQQHGLEKIDMLFTDMVMPRMGGRELADSLRALRASIKVLFTSGYTDEMFLPQDKSDVSRFFLPKPYTPSVMTRKVREVLDRAP